MMKPLLLILFWVALAGCGSNGPVPERKFFLIQVERGGAAREPVAGTLRIGQVSVASPFNDRPLIYRRDDVRYEADFYSQFAADPVDMVADAAVGWLRQSGLFRQVIAPDNAAPFDFRLDASVSALYVDFQAETPAAVLDIRWQVLREGDGSSVVSLNSRQQVPLAERTPAGAARAYRQALQQALTDLEKALAEARFS